MTIFLTCPVLLQAQVRSPAGQSRRGLDIFRLPAFERAVLCVKYFEGWHDARHYPYVGYCHRLRAGERYTSAMTRWQADALLREDLKKFCALFRRFGKDSLLLGVLAYNIGPYRLLGNRKLPRSALVRKLERGNRNIYREYTAYRHYAGKKHEMLLKRRKAEFALLFID